MNTTVKRAICETIIFAIFFVLSVYAQESPARPGGSPVAVGGYMSLTTKAGSLNSDIAGLFDLRIATTLDRTWSAGIGVSGLWYDKKLSALVNDGTYHLNAGYAGIFVEKFFDVAEDLSFSVSVLSGVGTAEYLYDREYWKKKSWSEEVIDRTTFTLIEPAVELSYMIGSEVSIGMMSSIRRTSPVELIGTSEKVFNRVNYGLTMRWRFL